MALPKISIIVPVYNAEQYIYRCIDSILSQTFTYFECILVNDCSSDNSGKICDEYAKRDIRIKIIHNTQNMGSSLSRKIGFENSTGEYIAFVDSDDWIEPDMLEKLYQKALYDNCDIAICDFFQENSVISKIVRHTFSSTEKIFLIKKIINNQFKTNLFNKLVERKLLLLVKFPQYSKSEDCVIAIQYAHFANKIGFIDESLYHYCCNEQSLSNDKNRKKIGRFEENKNWCMAIDFLKEKYGNIKIFEPELSIRINNLKQIYFMDKDLRTNKELFNLYPESMFYIKKLPKTIMKMFLPDKVMRRIKASMQSQKQ
ncbi:MAG: glycosyltransferase family 2 protein [Treponema sp.]|nr:glycosyltransferase family 2 protein [Treponema sp.]